MMGLDDVLRQRRRDLLREWRERRRWRLRLPGTLRLPDEPNLLSAPSTGIPNWTRSGLSKQLFASERMGWSDDWTVTDLGTVTFMGSASGYPVRLDTATMPLEQVVGRISTETKAARKVRPP